MDLVTRDDNRDLLNNDRVTFDYYPILQTRIQINALLTELKSKDLLISELRKERNTIDKQFNARGNTD